MKTYPSAFHCRKLHFWWGSYPFQLIIVLATLISRSLRLNRSLYVHTTVFWSLISVLPYLFCKYSCADCHTSILVSGCINTSKLRQLLEYFGLSAQSTPPWAYHSLGDWVPRMVVSIGPYIKVILRYASFSKILLSIVAVFIVLGILQRITDAQSIYWLSGVPTFAKRQFNPFIQIMRIIMAMTFPLVFSLPQLKWRWVLGYWIIGLALAQSRGGWLAA